MRAYFPNITVLSSMGNIIRRVPSGIAHALVESGNAAAIATKGRTREVQLIRTASTHAEMIGPPTGRATGVRFFRWSHLDSGTRVYEHHPRCTYED